MRGMPKLYEYNINQKYKKISSANFTEVLMQKILKLYDTVKITISKIYFYSSIYENKQKKIKLFSLFFVKNLTGNKYMMANIVGIIFEGYINKINFYINIINFSFV